MTPWCCRIFPLTTTRPESPCVRWKPVKVCRRDQFLKELRRTLLDELDLAPEQIRFTSLLVLYNNVLQSLFSSQILTLARYF